MAIRLIATLAERLSDLARFQSVVMAVGRARDSGPQSLHAKAAGKNGVLLLRTDLVTEDLSDRKFVSPLAVDFVIYV